jgi:hypothetical protein
MWSERGQKIKGRKPYISSQPYVSIHGTHTKLLQYQSPRMLIFRLVTQAVLLGVTQYSILASALPVPNNASASKCYAAIMNSCDPGTVLTSFKDACSGPPESRRENFERLVCSY